MPNTIPNAAPMRFLRAGQVTSLMVSSPNNRGGVGRLPKSDAEALKIINNVAPRALAGEPLTLDEIYVQYLEAANSNFIPDRWMFLDTDTTLKNIATYAVAGFAFMNSHRTGSWLKPGELPYGRTFCGRFEKITEATAGDDEENNVGGDRPRERVVVGFYMLRGQNPNGEANISTDDMNSGIEAGTIFDCSVGLWGGETICDVCGNDLWAFDYETYNWLCNHVPGTIYRMSEAEIAKQKERGVPDGCASFSLVDAYPGEVSACFDGAVPGAGFGKAVAMLAAYQTDEIPTVAVAQMERAYARFTPTGATLATFAHSQGASRLFGEVIPSPRHSDKNGRTAAPKLSGGKGDKPMGKLSLKALTALLRGQGVEVEEDVNLANDSGSGGNPAPAAAPAPAPPAASDPAVLALNAKIDDLNNQLAAEKAARAEQEKAAKLAANNAWIDARVKDFSLTAGAADKFRALAKDHPEAFEAAKAGIEANGKVVGLSGFPDGQNPGGNGDTIPAEDLAGGSNAEALSKRLDALAKQYQKDHAGVSYSEAFTAVCRENPDLARAYSEATKPTAAG